MGKGQVVQPGFGVVAAAYVWRRDDYRLLNRLQTPSLEGVARIGLGALGYELVVVPAVTPLLPAIGLHHGPHSGTATWRVLVAHPSLVLPGLIVMFAVMAPMEELLYRGVVHDILDPVLGPLGRVLVGASCSVGYTCFSRVASYHCCSPVSSRQSWGLATSEPRI